LAGVLALFVMILALGGHIFQAAKRNPTEALRAE